jgi:hypothetical protein
MDGYIRMINGEPAYVEPPEEEIMVPFAIDEESIEASQAKMPELDALRRRRDFEEIELGFERMQAVKEASRCLRCDAEIP